MSEQIVDSRDGRPRIPPLGYRIKAYVDRTTRRDRDWLIIKPEKPPMEAIASEVARRHGLLPSILYVQYRNARIFNARAEAMLVCSRTGYSVRAIARHFNKDRGSVRNAISKAELRMKMGAV